MPGAVRNKDAFLKKMKASIPKVDQVFTLRVKNVVTMLHHEIVSRTPVWSGSAIANYQWSIGIPAVNKLDPIDNGPPGATNDMLIGTEPRRPPNQALADQSLAQLNLQNPYSVFWLSNNDPDIAGIEYGTLPPYPLKIRATEGMIRVSFEIVVARLKSGQI